MTTALQQLASRRRLNRAIGVLGGGVILAAAAWAFWPVHIPASPPPVVGIANAVRKPAEFDASPFRTNLSRVPPKTVIAPAPPPPPPIKLQLLAIRTSADGRKSAVLFDPEDDRTIDMAEGELHKGNSVVSIRAEAVEIRQGMRTQRLVLDSEAPR